jgi:hypothetical protein
MLAFCGVEVDPRKINPYRRKDDTPKAPKRTPEELERESKLAWKLLGEALGDHSAN